MKLTSGVERWGSEHRVRLNVAATDANPAFALYGPWSATEDAARDARLVGRLEAIAEDMVRDSKLKMYALPRVAV